MHLLPWPSRKNFLKAIVALDKLENSDPGLIRPSHIAMALDIPQREAKIILESAERANALSSYYIVTCPQCKTPYNQYESQLDIPKETDYCDNCHNQSLPIELQDIEKVYRVKNE